MKNKILEIARRDKVIRILDLSKTLKVSRETIRRYICELEKEGLLKKTYGGGVLDEANVESPYEKRRMQSEEAKSCMAKQALSLIEPGDSIYLDFGTSTYALAQELLTFKNLTVVSNSLPIINLLSRSPDIDLIVLGGQLRRNENSLCGHLANCNAQEIFIDLGFFSCAGLDAQTGLSNYYAEEIELSKLMMKRAKSVILLADSSKFGKSALYKSAKLDDIDILICDKMDDAALADRLSELSIQVMTQVMAK